MYWSLWLPNELDTTLSSRGFIPRKGIDTYWSRTALTLCKCRDRNMQRGHWPQRNTDLNGKDGKFPHDIILCELWMSKWYLFWALKDELYGSAQQKTFKKSKKCSNTWVFLEKRKSWAEVEGGEHFSLHICHWILGYYIGIKIDCIGCMFLVRKTCVSFSKSVILSIECIKHKSSSIMSLSH